MPSPVQPHAPVAPVAPVARPASGAAPGAFASTLQRARQAVLDDPSGLPSVTLAQMLGGQLVGAPTPSGSAVTATSPTSQVAAPSAGKAGVLQAAEKYLGVPYLWGGTDPEKGLDCSGFVQRVYADLGVSLPRVSRDQAKAGEAVGSLAEARPGDLVYWSGNPNHIGIYAGEGRMIVSPHTGANVRYESLGNRRAPDAIRRVA